MATPFEADASERGVVTSLDVKVMPGGDRWLSIKTAEDFYGYSSKEWVMVVNHSCGSMSLLKRGGEENHHYSGRISEGVEGVADRFNGMSDIAGGFGPPFLPFPRTLYEGFR